MTTTYIYRLLLPYVTHSLKLQGSLSSAQPSPHPIPFRPVFNEANDPTNSHCGPLPFYSGQRSTPAPGETTPLPARFPMQVTST